MWKRAALLVFACGSPASAQTLPYKLIVAFDRGGVTTVDYPSGPRCEKARAAIYADFQGRLERSRANNMPGTIITGPPYHFEAVCVPG